MKNIRRFSVVLLTLLVGFIFVPVAWAHPLGNFTINQYVGLHITREAILVDYVIDMAEIPALQEIKSFDSKANGPGNAAETVVYHAQKCTSLLPSLGLTLNQRAVDLTLISSSTDFPEGVGGLPTLRLTCEFRAPLVLSNENVSLSFSNTAFAGRLGWKEIVVIPDGIALQGEYAKTSLSNRLTEYPQDLLSSPLEQTEIEIDLIPAAMPSASNSSAIAVQTSSLLRDRNDAFSRLILIEEITFPTLLLALGIAFFWGAAHAMTPGHGKAIVGAYLVGSRGTFRHALYLGLTTTITHTLGVFAFGLITLFAAQYIVPERLFPWIAFSSGLFVVAIGLNLLFQRFKSSGLDTWFSSWSITRRRLQPVLSPSLDSIHIEPDAHRHEHNLVFTSVHGHTHDHHNHHAHGHHHDHEHEHNHHPYGHADHSHTPPEAITWRSILAMGVSGGLLPCPSALVVLLGAIALNRVGFGLILVFAFSLGLAGALTAIGMLFIYAGKLFERVPSRGKIINLLPVVSALFISLIGLGILYKAWVEIGIM